MNAGANVCEFIFTPRNTGSEKPVVSAVTGAEDLVIFSVEDLVIFMRTKSQPHSLLSIEQPTAAQPSPAYSSRAEEALPAFEETVEQPEL